jgi:ADP-ribosylglycohydrolase
MSGGDFAEYLRRDVRAHPDRGYGFMFRQWAMWDAGPYNSWGNGSAMRVSPVAHLAGGEAEALELGQMSAAVSHNHPEGVKGAQAVALAIWMAKSGAEPDDIGGEISARFDYGLGRSVDDIRPGYEFDVSCAGSVPEAIICALQAADYEDAVRNAVSIGGDSDTIACIAGGIAEAFCSASPAISPRPRADT